MMPNKYKITLKEAHYSIWYYPYWYKKNQSNEDELRGISHKHQSFTRNKPESLESPVITLVDPKGSENSVSVKRYEIVRGGLLAGPDYLYVVKVGEIRVKKTGDFFISAQNKLTSDNFVITLVPEKYLYPANRGKRGSPFRRYRDHNFAKVYSSD